MVYIDDLVCLVNDPGSSNVTYFACRNHNFSVTAMLNSSGGVAERYDYNPYGERLILNPDYTTRSSSAISNPVGFQGLFHDDETGLIYVRNRYLNTALGRWMTRDPKRYSDGQNLYEYVRSRSVVLMDPSGTSCGDWKPAGDSSVVPDSWRFVRDWVHHPDFWDRLFNPGANLTDNYRSDRGYPLSDEQRIYDETNVELKMTYNWEVVIVGYESITGTGGGDAVLLKGGSWDGSSRMR